MQLTSSAVFESSKVIVQQLSYGIEKANTYMIEHDGHAIMIDACSSGVVKELRNIIPDYVILTHEHCDHLWGLNILRDAFPEIKVIAQEKCSKAITSSKTNKAKQYHIYAVLRFGESYQNDEARNRGFCCEEANIAFSEHYHLNWHGLEIEFKHAPGHSPGSVIIEVQDVGLFTGDSMILDDETFLKFDGGNEGDFEKHTKPLIDTIDEDEMIFPGHGRFFRKNEWTKKRKSDG